MRVYIWSDGAAMPNGGPAGAGYVVVGMGGVHLLSSEPLGDRTNNVAEYMAVRNALRAAADAGATSAYVRMDSAVVVGHLTGVSRARAEHLIQLKEEVEAQKARYPGGSGSLGFPGRRTELPTSSRRTARGPRRREAPIGGDRCASSGERCSPMSARYRNAREQKLRLTPLSVVQSRRR
jgi:hypothetical protein